MRVPHRTPVVSTSEGGEVGRFPFGAEFQAALLRLLTEDPGFASAVIGYLEPGYFENEVLSWVYTRMVAYRERYEAIPNLRVIDAEASSLDEKSRDFYRAVVAEVREADLGSRDWLMDRTLDFVKRNIFVRAHEDAARAYNAGDVTKAYQINLEASERILHTDWKAPDREFFFQNLAQRQADRLSADPMMESVSTGIHELDHILGGGLSKGELGVFMGHAKRGKTAMLANLGVQAIRRGDHRVFHAVFEGSRRMVADRYDTIFAQEPHSLIQRGGISTDRYRALQYEYGMFADRLIVRGFTEGWDYTVADIDAELKDLRRLYGWVPDLIVVDYGDLLRGRGQHKTETQHQTAVFRDLKTLANRGYAVWTATQPQRPKTDPDLKAELLCSQNVADAYAKIRIADFFASLNQTREEREAKQMRLYAELYRGNAADQVIYVHADFERMTISGIRDPDQRVLPDPVHAPVPLGYGDGDVRDQKWEQIQGIK